MQLHNLLVHLHSEVDAFAIKPRHLAAIRDAFPGIELTVAEHREEFLRELAGAEWVMTWAFQPAWYGGAPKLRGVFTPAAGHDWVTPDSSGRVRNFYGRFHGRIMRESLLAMMLHFNRRMAGTAAHQREKIWDRELYHGCSALFSQRVVIVGYGAIGSQIAQLLKAFGATVVGVRRAAGNQADPHADAVVPFTDLPAELPWADHVVLVLPGGADTEGIFTAAHLAAMKPGSYLYNLGRGTCYREDELVAALRHGPLAGAGLDVFDREPLPPDSVLWDLENVIITPHASAISREYIDLYIREWCEVVRQLPEV